MKGSRGIDVIVGMLVAVLALELFGVLIGQRMIWARNSPLEPLFEQPWIPGVAVVGVCGFALEGVFRKRDERAMLARVMLQLVLAIGMPTLAVIGRFAGLYGAKHPVG